MRTQKLDLAWKVEQGKSYGLEVWWLQGVDSQDNVIVQYEFISEAIARNKLEQAIRTVQHIERKDTI
jgi:hypothetical protein